MILGYLLRRNQVKCKPGLLWKSKQRFQLAKKPTSRPLFFSIISNFFWQSKQQACVKDLELLFPEEPAYKKVTSYLLYMFIFFNHTSCKYSLICTWIPATPVPIKGYILMASNLIKTPIPKTTPRHLNVTITSSYSVLLLKGTQPWPLN